MRSALFSLALLVVVSSISAQEQPTGIPPFSSVQSIGIDGINRQNLNVNFSVPIVSSPGRGLNFNFPVTNDSLLWVRGTSAWTPVVDAAGNPTWGWKTSPPPEQLGSLILLSTVILHRRCKVRPTGLITPIPTPLAQSTHSMWISTQSQPSAASIPVPKLATPRTTAGTIWTHPVQELPK